MAKISPMRYFVDRKSLDGLLSLEFYEATSGEPVSPAQIFDQYSNLDELIRSNRSDRKRSQSERHNLASVLASVNKSKSAEARKSLPTNYRARLIFDADKTIECFVKYRTNFEPWLIKRPSIVELNDAGVPLFIFREARTYDQEALQPAFDSMGGHDVRRNYATKTLNAKKANLVPEPILVKALEEVYALGCPRITVPFHTVCDDGMTMHYVRTFFGTSLRDAALDPQLLGEYVGKVHSYGLMELLDRTTSQYVVSPVNGTPHGEIANIDPDFFVWSGNEAYFVRDLASYVHLVYELYRMISEAEIKHMEDVRKTVMNQHKDLKHELGLKLKQYYPKSGNI